LLRHARSDTTQSLPPTPIIQSERMLDAVTTNDRAEHRKRLSSAPGKRFGFRSSQFFSMKSCSLQIT